MKTKLSTLVSWGKIRNYEAKRLEKLGFTEVWYEDRMSTIKNIDKNCNYEFWTDTSRSGWTRVGLHSIKPYKELNQQENKNCYSMWQMIKYYENEILEVQNESNKDANN